MPFIIPITYFFIIPRPEAFLASSLSFDEDESMEASSALPYTPLATEDVAGEEEGSLPAGPTRSVALSASDKWRLVKPLLPKYMLPLCK